MKLRIASTIYLLFVICLTSFLGCYKVDKKTITPNERPQPEYIWQTAKDTIAKVEEDTVVAGIELDIELNPEWMGMSHYERLDSTVKLLEAAETRHEQGDFLAVEYYISRALELLNNIDPQDPEIDINEYEYVLNEVKHLYHNFIPELEFLPEESSPQAVLAGIEIAEGDTSNGENGMFEQSEITLLDSSKLDSMLALQISIPPIPLSDHPKVLKAIEFFQNKGRKVFNKWLERAEYNIPLMRRILEKENLPPELVYLAMIESGFNPKAYSYAHAAGPWQFIRSTGRIFGLKIDWWYDERRDPVKSTEAAAKYLKKLYLEFEDWYLALAAYNCGEGKVHRHVARYKTRDFWLLKKLPRQTRNYIPTFLAALTIAENPTQYGFQDFVLKNPPPYDSVLVTECIDLKLIAEIVGLTYDEIKDMNPALVRWCTPPTQDSIWLKIPLGEVDNFYQGLAQIPEEQKRSWVRHKVQRGETLSLIAQKYGTSMSAIVGVKSNGINNKHKIRQGQILLIPVPPYKYSREWASNEPSNFYYPPEAGDRITYTVRRGDNLSLIASRNGTTVNKLRRWNNLYGERYIYPGQKLTIWLQNPPSEDYHLGQSGSSSPDYVNRPKFHTVQKGESLWVIAKQYGMSLTELKRLNDIWGNDIIRPGDKLLLRSDDYSLSTTGGEILYTVRQGDTLWDIAKSYGVRLEDLKRANNIDGASVIRPGDILKIPN